MENISKSKKITISVVDRRHCSMNCTFLNRLYFYCHLYGVKLISDRNFHDTTVVRTSNCQNEFGGK